MAQRDRELFLIEMQAGVGLSAAPATLVDFENSIGGAEKPPMRRSMATYRVKMPDGTWRFSSTCGLKIREAMRRAGYTATWLHPDYIPASVMTNIKTEGQRAHAVNVPTPANLPSSGDVFGLGWDRADAHVAAVESILANEDGTVTVIAIEAGQIDPQSRQACARKRHTWTWDARTKTYTDRSKSLTPGIVDGQSARPVSWWIDMAKLPAGGPTDPFAPASGQASSAPRGSAGPAAAPTSPQASPGGGAPTMPTLRRGASGDAVRNWQDIIGVTADGAFGPATEAATKAWQAAHGLTADGVVGPATWRTAGVGATGQGVGVSPKPAIPSGMRVSIPPLPSSTPAPATGATLPQVPGLLEREAREPGFCRSLLEVLTQAGANVDRVTALMAEESRFNPAAHNPAGGASGLLQWMPFLWTNPKTGPAFRAVAPTPEALRALTATQQLPLVAYTLQLWGKGSAQDPALAGWGSNVGSPDDTVLATKDEAGRVAFYRDNAGYDRNKDGRITAGEVRAAVYGLLVGAAGKPRVGADGRPL